MYFWTVDQYETTKAWQSDRISIIGDVTLYFPRSSDRMALFAFFTACETSYLARTFNSLPDMAILDSSNSAANTGMMSKMDK